MQKTLGLAKRQVEEKPERQRGIDGEVGVLPRPHRVPLRAGFQVAIVSGDSHTVTSPRRTSARS